MWESTWACKYLLVLLDPHLLNSILSNYRLFNVILIKFLDTFSEQCIANMDELWTHELIRSIPIHYISGRRRSRRKYVEADKILKNYSQTCASVNILPNLASFLRFAESVQSAFLVVGSLCRSCWPWNRVCILPTVHCRFLWQSDSFVHPAFSRHCAHASSNCAMRVRN